MNYKDIVILVRLGVYALGAAMTAAGLAVQFGLGAALIGSGVAITLGVVIHAAEEVVQ